MDTSICPDGMDTPEQQQRLEQMLALRTQELQAALDSALTNLQSATERLKGPQGAMGVLMGNDEDAKKLVEANIQADFDDAYEGIMQLPNGARMGVYLAYIYYVSLFNKIKKTAAEVVKSERIRVSDRRKIGLLLQTYLRGSLNIL